MFEWLAGCLAPFWFPCSRNTTIRQFCSGKGQNFHNTIAPPPHPQLSPPTIWFLPFNLPIRVQREGCVCQMRNYMQRGGRIGSGRGGRLRRGGFPSVVRTPSVPHFQLPIFLSSRNFHVFFIFFLLFVYARNLGTLLFIIVVPWPFQHMPIFRITNFNSFWNIHFDK